MGRALFYGAGTGAWVECLKAAWGFGQLRRGSGAEREVSADSGEVHDVLPQGIVHLQYRGAEA